MLLPAINPCLVFGLCGYLSETILCESGISAMTVDIYLIPVELRCMEPFETWEKTYKKTTWLNWCQISVINRFWQAPEFFGPPPRKRTWKHEHGAWKRGEILLEIIILYPKKSWKQPFPPPDGLVWCPPARATTRVVSCAIWLISSAEETWSTWRFFGLRSMAFEAPWRSSSTRISMTTAMYWQTKSSEAVLGLCSLFLDVLDVSWNEWEYLPFWCQLEQDLVHQQHQYSDRWLFVSATSLCWIFTNKLTSQKDCEKRLEFI